MGTRNKDLKSKEEDFDIYQILLYMKSRYPSFFLRESYKDFQKTLEKTSSLEVQRNLFLEALGKEISIEIGNIPRNNFEIRK